ncbi:F0F1 ATP synthase subunit gamma [Leucothrix pacifica]|uniref:F0F1 ATP synthase subunit gamma n=1 Tax=Leucothrix pacifica TaxID=1247513 RepID=A0A317C1H6_9GAMM|nr:F0F1 ATP synthase subunit gamma [Leucothrix pacifica]PWQ92207.1 F0F1 ATP synthase subunit gamma [Leucothrix pacifica]
MAESLEALRSRVDSAVDLQAVVRTMKAMSASGITQYENAVSALDGYFETVEQGLVACLKQTELLHNAAKSGEHVPVAVIVFGSDQGLVGQFNDTLAEFVQQKLTDITGEKKIWVVGERMYGHLQDADLALEHCFNVPGSVDGVTPLVGELLLATEHLWETGEQSPLYLFHQRPGKLSGQYKPRMHQLLPLDLRWQKALQEQVWTGPSLPETLGSTGLTLRALVREYLFVSLYQTCAESLASENSSRLVAMQRAEKNIEEMLAGLQHEYHHQRQEAIDEELFDLVAGFGE